MLRILLITSILTISLATWVDAHPYHHPHHHRRGGVSVRVNIGGAADMPRVKEPPREPRRGRVRLEVYRQRAFFPWRRGYHVRLRVN